jgi:hypothetical protein
VGASTASYGESFTISLCLTKLSVKNCANTADDDTPSRQPWEGESSILIEMSDIRIPNPELQVKPSKLSNYNATFCITEQLSCTLHVAATVIFLVCVLGETESNNGPLVPPRMTADEYGAIHHKSNIT